MIIVNRALGILLLLLALPAQAMTWEEYQKRRDEHEIKFYIAGVGGGYYYANNYLDTTGRARLYCQPAKDNISGELYQGILESYVANSRKRVEGVSVEILLLAALTTIYPCR